VLANQEYTVFAVFDDENNSNSLKLYVNSSNNPVSGYSSVDIADIKNYSSFSPAWYVGRHGTPTDPRTFSGSIAEVAIYDTALTGTDISELFQGKDDWTVSIETTDGVATERLDGVLPDYGEWVIRRTNDNFVKDTSYAIETNLMLVGNATLNDDYVLQRYNAETNTWAVLSASLNTFPHLSVSIPDGQTEVKIRLVPVFDWLDEGTLFVPTPSLTNTPFDDAGENVFLVIFGTTWSAKGTDWNAAVGGGQSASIEIKDGAIIRITTDSNNDGQVNTTDSLPDVKNIARQMFINSDDDNNNGIQDLLERPLLYDTPQNQMLITTDNYGSVTNENDLAETKLYVWIDSLTSSDPAKKFEIDVYATGPSDLVMWSTTTKGKHLHYGTYGPLQGRMDYQRTLKTTLSATNTSFSKAVYIEAVDYTVGGVNLTADIVCLNVADSSFIARLDTGVDTAYYEASQSSWTITRSGQPTATVVSGAGDMIYNLAREAGLEATEFQSWLIPNSQTVTLQDGTFVSAEELRVDHKLAAGQTFEIPNTILMAWFGETGTAGKAYMGWSDNINDLTNLGFKVETFDNDTYPKTVDGAAQACNAYKNMIENLSNNKQLHGLYMMGHGGNNSIGSSGTNVYTAGPDWSIPYVGANSIASVAMYKLGALIIQACSSDNSNARFLVSDYGIFYGASTGNYVPTPSNIALHWGYHGVRVIVGNVLVYEYGGKQHTNKFER
jgi:hypothetical protein